MLHALLGVAAGSVLGLAFFAILEWLIGRWLAGDRSIRVFAWQASRLTLTIAGFVGLARLGAAALLAGLGGFLLARTVQTLPWRRLPQ